MADDLMARRHGTPLGLATGSLRQQRTGPFGRNARRVAAGSVAGRRSSTATATC
jgi:hypothetical protein